MDFPKILESSPSNVVGTAQIRLNKRTGGQLMMRGRVGLNSTNLGSNFTQPQLKWTLQLPGIIIYKNKQFVILSQSLLF